MEKNICGDRIKIARSRKKMKQIDVAVVLEEHKIYLNQTAIGKIERGERYIHDYEVLALSTVLDVSVEWLLKGGDLMIE
jgi:transcriptional regulator with XRE-family HTH domain